MYVNVYAMLLWCGDGGDGSGRRVLCVAGCGGDAEGEKSEKGERVPKTKAAARLGSSANPRFPSPTCAPSAPHTEYTLPAATASALPRTAGAAASPPTLCGQHDSGSGSGSGSGSTSCCSTSFVGDVGGDLGGVSKASATGLSWRRPRLAATLLTLCKQLCWLWVAIVAFRPAHT